MKISEILVEAPDDATAKMKEYLRKNKGKLTPDQLDAYFGKQGGKIGKIAYGTLARDKNVAAQRNSSRQAGSYTKKTTTPTVITQPDAKTVAKPNTPPPGTAVAKPKKAPRYMRGQPGEFDGAPVAKTVAKPNTPPPGTAVAKPKKAPRYMRGQPGEFAGTPVAKTKKSAIVNPGVKAGQTASAAGEFGSNKPRANIASTTNMSGAATNQQAASKFAKARPKAVAKPKKAPMPDNWRDGVGDHGK